ncbi:MAG: histone deacetylase family protein [Phycisphaerales bacterium]
MDVGLVYHEQFLTHDTGYDHPERPDRLRAVIAALEAAGLRKQLHDIAFQPAEATDIDIVHDAVYVDRLREACESGRDFIDSMDTPICANSYNAALWAAGGMFAAVDLIMAGDLRAAFCPVRPPGHHAEKGGAMGFCLFNNIALAAERLIRTHGLKRVAIVDFDVHHGNGTQHIFEKRPDVLFISMHEHPKFQFPGTGYAHETGVGEGIGATLNIPFLPGAGDAEAQQAMVSQVLPKLEKFDPEFLLCSAGFDAVAGDPLGHLQWSVEQYGRITTQLCEFARMCCRGRFVSVMEGGYDLDLLGRCAVQHVGAMIATMSSCPTKNETKSGTPTV